ncbi:MAG: hypothetical protein M3503_03555 [Actinomycetota bacterium]|nr:hypothetical protein [Actinomycetota bacterium]
MLGNLDRVCMTCVATGSAYVVPAVVGLRLQAVRLRRRRIAGVVPVPDTEARTERVTARSAD